jgi:hypothetical protein
MAVGRIYTVEFEALSVTTADGDQDLFELDPGADKPIELIGLELWSTSELQEAQEEWLRLRIIRGHTTSGSTPAVSPTPVPTDDGYAAAGFTCEVGNETLASAGTGVNAASFAFNVRTGFERFWPEGSGFRARGANLIVVRLMAAPADDLTMNGTAYISEF